MAVPTIISISPITGQTSGQNICVITGTNFRLPTVDYPGSAGMKPYPKTVNVFFAGVECEYAESASATIIYCKVPIWSGDYSLEKILVSVKVENVDENGVAIPTESAIAQNAYEYKRPSLTEEGSITAACRAFVKLLRRHLIKNTNIYFDRYFVSDSRTMEKLKNSAPSILLIGPKIVDSSAIAKKDQEPKIDENNIDKFNVVKNPVVVDLSFSMNFVGTGIVQTTNFCSQAILFIRDVKEILIEGKYFDIVTLKDEIPTPTTVPSDHGLCFANFGMTIKNFEINDTVEKIVDKGFSLFNETEFVDFQIVQKDD